MIKRHIVETVEEFNEEGNVICKTITETTEEEDNKISSYGPVTIVNNSTDGLDVDEIANKIIEKISETVGVSVK